MSAPFVIALDHELSDDSARTLGFNVAYKFPGNSYHGAKKDIKEVLSKYYLSWDRGLGLWRDRRSPRDRIVPHFTGSGSTTILYVMHDNKEFFIDFESVLPNNTLVNWFDGEGYMVIPDSSARTAPKSDPRSRGAEPPRPTSPGASGDKPVRRRRKSTTSVPEPEPLDVHNMDDKRFPKEVQLPYIEDLIKKETDSLKKYVDNKMMSKEQADSIIVKFTSNLAHKIIAKRKVFATSINSGDSIRVATDKMNEVTT